MAINYEILNSTGPAKNIFAPQGAQGSRYTANVAGGGWGGVPGSPMQWYQGLRTEPYQVFEDLQRGDPTLRAGGATGAAGQTPVIDPVTGQYIDPATRQPVGVPVPYSPGKYINPNDPNQRYQAVNIVKSPEVASATQKLMDTFTKTASTALDDFNSYLSNFRNQIGTAATKSAAATDIGPFSQAMRGYQGAYSDALNQAKGDYANLNRETAGNLTGIVDEARGLIPEYDAAINRLRDYQVGQSQANINARYSAGATPRSMGSGLARELMRAESAITVPLEQAKIAQRYNVLGQYALPVATDIANRETNRIANFNPMVAAQQFQSGTATEQTIQQLAMVTANMSYDNALRYLQSLSVPWDTQQRILSGQIAQLGGLNQLYAGSRYQGLQDVLGTNVTPTIGYNLNLPGYPGAPRYGGPSQGQPSQEPMAAPNAPERPYPGSELIRDPATGQYFNKNTGKPSSYRPPTWNYRQVYPSDTEYSASNPSPWHYDPVSGQFINRQTGATQAGPTSRYVP